MNAYRRAGTIGALIAIMAVAVMGVCMAGASDADVGDYYETESTGPMKAAAAPTATVFDSAGLGYAVQSDGTLMLVSVPGDAVNVVVPATVDDNGAVRDVARLFSSGANGSSAFSNHKVASIDFKCRSVGAYDLMYQFRGCTGLTSVTLPDTWVKTLGSMRAFYECSSLKQITLTTLPTMIGADALYGTPTPIYVVGLTSEQISAMNALAGVSSKFAAAPIVTFDANGGTEMAPVQGLTVTLPTDATRAPIGTAADGTTYTLAYYEAADGTRYQPGETIELSGDMELTARWLATTVEPGTGALSGSAAVLVWVVPLLLVVGIVVTVIGMLVVRRD